MLEAAQALEFEKAASIRDKLAEVKLAPAFEKVRVNKSKTAVPKPGTPGVKPVGVRRSIRVVRGIRAFGDSGLGVGWT